MAEIIWKNTSDRIKRLREKYRNTVPEVCSARLNIVTEYYKAHPALTGELLRAGRFKDLCEKMPIRIWDDEILISNLTEMYRGSALYPEGDGIGWLPDELKSGVFESRTLDKYIISEKVKEDVLSADEFWKDHCVSRQVDEACPDGFAAIVNNGVIRHRGKGLHGGPVGHFAVNYNTALKKGFKVLSDEAKAKMAALEGKVFGADAEKYIFYKSVAICSDAAITYSKRCAEEVRNAAKLAVDDARKNELLQLAECLDWIFVNPVRHFYEAVQAVLLLQNLLALEDHLHGLTIGRLDQYLGQYYEKDIVDGYITPDYAQEILDQFFLKISEMNKVKPDRITMSVGGYTSGQLTTLGGVDENGNDASNEVSYMMLQSAGRLQLHEPPLALRVHKDTPMPLFKLAVRCSQLCGGVPTFESDDVIIPALMDLGHSLKSARNYCLIGCVEPAGCGNDWPAPGGSSGESYFNLSNTLWHAINNGVNPLPLPGGKEPKQTGLATGYLYEMKTFDEVLAAYRAQLEFFVDWFVTMTNMFEYTASIFAPAPLVSALMDGCMEKGKDVMSGGAEYNSCGIAGVGTGTAADSLTAIKYLVFDKKICTAKELYDAIMANWEGYEELRDFVLNKVPHYGNADPYADEIAQWVVNQWTDIVNSKMGPRGRYKAGLWSVARHVADGPVSWATPDGRKLGEPLSDGISPKQGATVSGPTSTILSVGSLNHRACCNGTLLNMRFQDSVIKTEEDLEKFIALIKSYFAMNGMELQFNMINTETLKDAQVNPLGHNDLIVRVAGFSAYFVELHPALQNEIIRRSEFAL